MTKRDLDFNTIIGLVLRYGVVSSFAVIALGSALLLIEGQTGYGGLGSAEQLFSERSTYLASLSQVTQGVATGKPYAVISLGLIVLFATPVARVFISIFLFLQERKYAFVAITLTVFAILLFSTFVMGPLLSR